MDPIPTFLLKSCLPELVPSIATIVNCSLQTANVHTRYKQAVVKPLLKKPGLEPIYKNYRPVSNLTFISKVIEQAASNQIEEHISKQDIGEKFQSAYKASHSTETALVRVFDDILRQLDQGHVVYLALLDLTAAFDTVDHQVLLERLHRTFHLSGQVLSWVKSYLSDRSTVVSVNGRYHSPKLWIVQCHKGPGSARKCITTILSLKASL